MNGFNVAEAGHVINVIPPQNITGGVSGTPFSVKNCKHVSFLVSIGAIGNNKPTGIFVSAMQTLGGTGKTAIPFRYYLSKSGGVTQDQNSPPNVTVVGDGYGLLAAALSKIANQIIIIELDAEETDALGDSAGADYPWIELDITDSGNTTYVAALAVLSGNRHAYQGGGPSVTA